MQKIAEKSALAEHTIDLMDMGIRIGHGKFMKASDGFRGYEKDSSSL